MLCLVRPMFVAYDLNLGIISDGAVGSAIVPSCSVLLLLLLLLLLADRSNGRFDFLLGMNTDTLLCVGCFGCGC